MVDQTRVVGIVFVNVQINTFSSDGQVLAQPRACQRFVGVTAISAGSAQHAPSGRFGTARRCVWMFAPLYTDFEPVAVDSYLGCYCIVILEQ